MSRSKAPTQLFDQNNLALALRAAAAAFPCGSAAALLRSGVPGDGNPSAGECENAPETMRLNPDDSPVAQGAQTAALGALRSPE